MLEIKNTVRCNGCHACANACPRKCIAMKPDSQGFLYPYIDEEKCSQCRLCERVCPVINMDELEREPRAYAAYCRDDGVRRQSSSGGMFTLLAQTVLKNGGAVFGAAFDDKFRLYHKCVQSMEELAYLRGSKYVQSAIGDAFRQAKDLLEQGRQVLFTGTPCQIGGLRAYLGEDYDGLVCQDVICHGVPSPEVWQAYLAFREVNAGAPLESMTFRDKREGWENYAVTFCFQNGQVYSCGFRDDPYMRAFLENLSLRPSCGQCAFKGIERQGDLTLADFWGVQDCIPELTDGKGTSLVIVNTEKGKTLFEKIKPELIFIPADFKKAVSYNISAVESSQLHPKQKKFFNRLNRMPFDRLVKKCTADGLVLKLKKGAYCILKRHKKH